MQQHDENNRSVDFKRLQAIIDGDGSEIRQQFIYAGLLLTIFERFKDYVVDRVDEFLAHRFEVRDGDLIFTRSEEFKAIIKEKGMGDAGQHRNKDFRAALRWLHGFNAIDQAELDHVERLYGLRNEIGHELFRIVADDAKAPIQIIDVVMTLAIYVKVVRWWIKEIDAATDPDMTKEKYESAAWDSAESSDTVFLRLILRKSLAGDRDWEDLQRAMQESA
ncbi:MAG: hypothetical protein QOJ15_587 [Bradyrhizobium sp.]|jgi:hypothetical protein|nr:hypothetical protein [Bradyrhizobium sp.]